MITIPTSEKSSALHSLEKSLRASSFEWLEAIELMQTRDAVEAMMVIMKNEETFGRPDIPVWVERTAVGSSVQVCQRA